MGQGTESCGGYDVEYDEYEEGLADGLWTQRGGSSIRIRDMTTAHIRRSITVCENARKRASFSCDTDKWDNWIDIFEIELHSRGESKFKPLAHYDSPSMIKPTRGAKFELICHCGAKYSPRIADLKRGWARSCSKRCASIKRDYGKPDPRCSKTGVTVSKLLKGLK